MEANSDTSIHTVIQSISLLLTRPSYPNLTGNRGLVQRTGCDSVSQQQGLPVQPARQTSPWYSQHHHSIDNTHLTAFWYPSGCRWSMLRH